MTKAAIKVERFLAERRGWYTTRQIADYFMVHPATVANALKTVDGLQIQPGPVPRYRKARGRRGHPQLNYAGACSPKLRQVHEAQSPSTLPAPAPQNTCRAACENPRRRASG